MSADLTDPKLYGRKELAEALGVKPWFIRRMIFVGFKMPLGKASLAMAHRFIEEQADLLTKIPQAPKRPRRSASDK